MFQYAKMQCKEVMTMEELVLVKPNKEYTDEIMGYKNEFLAKGDSMDGCGSLRRCTNASEYLDVCKSYESKETLPIGKVVATQFFYVRKSDNKIVGMIQVRHYFNEYLEKYAGHIGYSVRPSERRKGYAKSMLKEALKFCKEIGLERVMVTCEESNIGSEKTILANGGVFEYTIHQPEENINLKRYWIDLKES